MVTTERADLDFDTGSIGWGGSARRDTHFPADRFRVGTMYRVFHLLRDQGWVDFDLGVPPSCPAAQLLLPNSHEPKRNWADG